MLDYNLVLKSDELFLVGNISTEDSGERATGLYLRDTRHLNRFRVALNGVAAAFLSSRIHSATSATVDLTNPALPLANGDHLRPHQVVVEQHVRLHSALDVSLVLANYALEQVAFDLTIEFDADFRDLFDIRGFPRDRRGDILEPSLGDRSATLAYQESDGLIVETEITFDRDADLRFLSIPEDHEPHLPVPAHVGVAARFGVSLSPGERWELEIVVRPRPAGTTIYADVPEPVGARAHVETDNLIFNRVLERSDLDLAELLTRFPEGTIPAAGIPWYVAPFGRDSLIVGLQTFHLVPQQAARTLRVLAALQGDKIDKWREEEPGKILHEMRYGEMARLGEVPHSPYFGTVDATPLFIWLFAETVTWTGDDVLYRELLPNIRRALEWIISFGDKDGDGLVEYRTDAKERGQITHQVWKDSFDSLHYPDGRPVQGLVTPVEVQGYLYAAYSRLASVVEARGDSAWVEELRSKAESVRRTVEQAFWFDDEGYYAQALDGDKRPIRTIGSNAGHLLVTGLPAPERAARLAQRLRQSDLDSGWGIRTLSASARSYNPMSYHNGSVWPHDNSMIGAGLYQTGQTEGGHIVTGALFASAQTYPLFRLPELYCGFPRVDDANDEPVAYPVSCSPQAWAAGAIPLLVRAMLGLRACEDGSDRLTVSPSLPSWLNTVTIRDLQFREQRGTVVVRREQDGYRVDAEGLSVEA